MRNRLQKILLSAPVLSAAVLFVLYLAGGFLALPALVKGQIEKQVPEMLGHRISIGTVHFNPLLFSLSADDLLLSDPDGHPMVGAKRLLVDFELRSAIDQAWTFSQARLEAPLLHLTLDKNGRHNFSTLLERLAELKSGKDEGPLPRVVVQRLNLADARIEYSDGLLAEPLVTRIETQLEIENLSTLPSEMAQYRLTARSAAGETLEASGGLGLSPVAARGKLALSAIKLATLARALSRQLKLNSPEGTIDFAADFDFALGADGALSGGAGNVALALSSLLINAPGTQAPLAAIETIALKQGQIDLDRGEASFEKFHLARGRIAAKLGKDGKLDWAELMPVSAKADPGNTRIAAGIAAEGSSPSRKPWRISVADAEVANIELMLDDAAAGRSIQVDSLNLELSASADFGAEDIRVALDKPKLSIAGAALKSWADSGGRKKASVIGSALSREPAKRHLQLAGISSVRLAAESLALTIADGPVDVVAEGLSADLKNAVIRDPTDAGELLHLEKATLSGGTLNLLNRVFAVDKLTLATGKFLTKIDDHGKFNWLNLMPTAAKPPPISKMPAAAAPVTVPAEPPPWRLALKTAELDRLAINFEDRRETPAFAVGLEKVGARITGLDTASGKSMSLDVKARLGSGGGIEARGQVHPKSGESNLKIRLVEVALSPLQHYLSKFARLRIAGGTLSSVGRLRYGSEKTAGARLAYAGGISVDQVLIEEANHKQPFLAWSSVASDDVRLTLSPNGIDIGELRVEHPSGSLIIAEDRTVNLMGVLNQPEASGADSRAHASSDDDLAVAVNNAAADAIFPVEIARVRVSGGIIDFADLSLRPQFGTRMHEFQGVVTGLGSDTKRRSPLQFEARVDQYGSAKILGEINLRQPGQFTEIDMNFRNLEMTSLSPYVAKFAGYRIASGRLALDLQYRVADNKLLGENKIVLNQVELGEKVTSPDAIDLPLELAIAILKDSDGVIDVGLPISGDLGDPQFDYGAIIGKAIGNLLGSIVTAPFRALAALFGDSEEKLDSIDFEPGRAALAPPEQQKLATVARALKERPVLMLGVPPTYAVAQDTAALKSLTFRTELVSRMGFKLVPNEDPGPIDAANPRAQQAVDALFSQRYAPEVLAALKQRLEPTEAPSAEAAVKAETLPNQEAMFYQGLIDRLINETALPDQALAELASQRSAAVISELTTAGGVAASRVTPGKPRVLAEGNGKTVSLQLELEAAK